MILKYKKSMLFLSKQIAFLFAIMFSISMSKILISDNLVEDGLAT